MKMLLPPPLARREGHDLDLELRHPAPELGQRSRTPSAEGLDLRAALHQPSGNLDATRRERVELRPPCRETASELGALANESLDPRDHGSILRHVVADRLMPTREPDVGG